MPDIFDHRSDMITANQVACARVQGILDRCLRAASLVGEVESVYLEGDGGYESDDAVAIVLRVGICSDHRWEARLADALERAAHKLRETR